MTALWMAGAAAIGVASRRDLPVLSELFGTALGDALWALFVYLGVGLVWPRAGRGRAAAAAAAISLLIEVSQLHRAPWLDALRGTPVGALVLGRGFLWSDLVCYAAGIGLGVAGERIAGRPAAWEERP